MRGIQTIGSHHSRFCKSKYQTDRGTKATFRSLLPAFSLALSLPMWCWGSALPESVQTCCAELDNQFKGTGKVSFPWSMKYRSENRYWSRTSVGSPACIFSPTSTEDVAKAVKLLSEKNCAFAIRSGGHLPNPGFSSTDGILLSLSGLNQVTYDAEAGVVHIGTGNRWGKVYETLDKLGVTVAGGRSKNVGVGGFLLGGGFSFFSNGQGWGVDTVVNFEVVLGDGSVINANATENSELFRALKGGSSNFGVVTTFTMIAQKVSDITAGLMMYWPSSTPNLVEAYYNYIATGADLEPQSHIISAWIMFGVLPVLPTFTVFYPEHFDVKNPPPAAKSFMDGTIPAMSNGVKTQKGLTGIAGELGSGQPNGMRNQWQCCTVVADAALFQTIYDLWVSEARPYRLTVGLMNVISFQPITETFIKAGKEKGGNSMGISQPTVNVSVNVAWLLSFDDGRMNKYLDALYERIREAAKEAGKYSDYQYMNYAGPRQDPIKAYGAASCSELAQTKRKYDPTNVFGRLVQGGFKIPSAE